jgi:hypothetical protein
MLQPGSREGGKMSGQRDLRFPQRLSAEEINAVPPKKRKSEGNERVLI